MSEKLPVVTSKQLIRALEKKGWQLDRVRGSHHLMKHPVERRKIPVPMHNRDLKPGTLASILRLADISRDELRELL